MGVVGLEFAVFAQAGHMAGGKPLISAASSVEYQGPTERKVIGIQAPFRLRVIARSAHKPVT